MHIETNPRIIGQNIVAKERALKNRISNGITEFKQKDHAIRNKIVASIILGATTYGIDWGVGTALAMNKAGLIPDKFNNPQTLGAVYGFGVLVGILYAIQQSRLLKRFEMNSDWVSTSAYHGLGRTPLKEKPTIRSATAVAVPSLISFALTSPVYFSIAALSSEGVSTAIALRAGQEVFSLAQLGVMEIILRTAGKKKNAESKIQKTYVLDGRERRINPAGGVVFARETVGDAVRKAMPYFTGK
jgi:hypothetical protein